jgi:glyoxylate/hydroxypyruvate reductase A
VHVTPHIAGATNPRTASPGVIQNIANLRAGRPLINTVDPVTGY